MSFLADDLSDDSAVNLFDKYRRVIPAKAKDESGTDSDSDSDLDSDADDDLEGIPLSHQFELAQGKHVNSVRYTHAGDRLLTATRDCALNTYVFQAMNPSKTTPHQSVTPYDTYDISKIDIGTEGTLVLPKDSAFKILSADGSVKDFRSGDRYIYDAKQTKGHTDAITDGQFLGKGKVVTSSNDSTFRVWDVASAKQEKVCVIKNNGKKVKVTSIHTTPTYIIASDSTDRITFWDINSSSFTRPAHTLQLSSPLVSLAVSTTDPSLIAIRDQNSLKLYSTTNPSTPIMQRLNLASVESPALLFQNNHIFAPTSKGLIIMDRSDLVTLTTIPIPSLITAIDWNQKTNQIAIGTKSGQIIILFDPSISKNGIMITLQNKPKKRALDSMDQLTTSTTTIGFNMEELAEFNRNKKKSKRVADD